MKATWSGKRVALAAALLWVWGSAQAQYQDRLIGGSTTEATS
ncbi:MAG: hypothetical protein RLZZ126_219, partial [Pseudomonadota bacterium]